MSDRTDAPSAATVEHIDPARRYWLRRSWTRLWWRAINPDESLATVDTSTNYRAWTRERLLAKLRRMNEPKDDPWEEINRTSSAATKQRKLTKGELEDARRAAERLIEHWSTHQLHADWVYAQSREWLRLYGEKES